MIITRPEYIHTCVHMHASGCLRARAYSCVSCVYACTRERGWAFRQSLGVSPCDSVALDLCCLCCIVLSCAALYTVEFLIGFDVLQPMCADRSCFGKPQSISPITALTVRLTFWICYSPLFKPEHSLISCP